jgi:hypothetical protein
MPIEDRTIYNTTLGVMSGGVHSIHIEYLNRSLTFTLHNASHPLAEKIITILNSNIPKDQPELWLYNFSE